MSAGERRSVAVAIRDATVDDSERIARLVSDLGYRTTATRMRQRLEAIMRDEQYGQIMALAVAPDHQRSGIGRSLMQAAESRLVERGARELVVTTGNHRADAHAFYENRGYTFTGRRYTKSLLSSV